MVGWLERVGPRLGDASLAGLVLSTLAALGMVACRQPVRRLTIARATLAAILALGPLSAWSPMTRVDAVGPLLAVVPPIWNRVAPGPLCHGRAGHRSTWTPSGPWRARATAAYLVGASLGVAWLAMGCVGTARLRRRSRPASLQAQAILEELAADGGPRPELRVAPGLARPALIGVWRPSVMLPTSWDVPDRRDALRLCLLHERVHARRRDPGFALVAGLAQALWFYLPTVWWIRAQMRLDQEFLADHAAATGFGPFGTYAASLVDLADAGGIGGVERAGGGSALWPRVLMLVRCPFPFEARSGRWWRVAAGAIVAAAALLASGLTVQEPGPSSSPPLPTPAAGRFQLALLSLEHTSLPFRLPVSTPPHYDLTLEIWAEGPSLDALRIAGCRLSGEGAAIGHDGWRTIKLHRGPDGVEVRVDGNLVPQRGPGQASLLIDAVPRAPVFIRDLVLSW